MATDILFPFYEIFVNTIFGSVFLSIFIIGVIIAFILAISRTSWPFMVFWLLFYSMVMLTMYIGALGLVLTFIISMIYTVIALMRYVAGNWLNM